MKRIKEEEKALIEEVLLEGAAAITCGSPSTANTVKYRIIEYAKEKDIYEFLNLQIVDNILYVWIGVVFPSSKITPEIMDIAAKHTISRYSTYAYSQDKISDVKSTIIQRMNAPTSTEIETRKWLNHCLMTGVMSQAEYELRLNKLNEKLVDKQ